MSEDPFKRASDQYRLAQKGDRVLENLRKIDPHDFLITANQVYEALDNTVYDENLQPYCIDSDFVPEDDEDE